MAVDMREIYRSPNGDRWDLVRETDSGRVFVRHLANPFSGGHRTDIELDEFLSRGRGPEQQELIRLIGTLAGTS